jgi:hypothetical protein
MNSPNGMEYQQAGSAIRPDPIIGHDWKQGVRLAE